MKNDEAFIRARVLYSTQIGYFALEVHDTLEKHGDYFYNYLLVHMGIELELAAMEAYIQRFKQSKK